MEDDHLLQAKVNYRDFYDERSKKIVEAFYANELNHFGYSFWPAEA